MFTCPSVGFFSCLRCDGIIVGRVVATTTSWHLYKANQNNLLSHLSFMKNTRWRNWDPENSHWLVSHQTVPPCWKSRTQVCQGEVQLCTGVESLDISYEIFRHFLKMPNIKLRCTCSKLLCTNKLYSLSELGKHRKVPNSSVSTLFYNFLCENTVMHVFFLIINRFIVIFCF